MALKTTLLFILAFALSHSQTEFKLDSIHQYSWDMGLNDWKHNTRDLYTYDNGGAKETNLLRLNLNGMVWENFYQFNKTYNANNDLEENINQTWNGASWIDASRESYTYDTSNRKKTFAFAIYSMGSWVTFNENFYEYNAMGDLEEDRSTTRDFVNMVMVNDKRRTLFYQNGLLDYDIEEMWSPGLNDWVNSERKEYTYNINDDNTLVEIRAWGTMSMAWGSPYKQTITTYTANDLPFEITEQVMASGMWVNSTKITNTYDVNGNLKELLIQEWNGTLDDWENQSRQLRDFDADNNEIELIFETWNASTMMWEGLLRQVKFWSEADALSSEAFSFSESLKIYPNPVSDQLYIESNIPIDKILVYDLQGRRVKSVNNLKSISVKTLTPGMYILKAFSNDIEISKRIMVK